MRIVLDTNVLVSGLLSPFGPPGEIARMVSAGTLVLALDARIISEYSAVLSRPRFAFDPDMVDAFIHSIVVSSVWAASAPLRVRLPHPADEVFLEVALASPAECLVTGNTDHFPPSLRAEVSVQSPREFLDRWREAG